MCVCLWNSLIQSNTVCAEEFRKRQREQRGGYQAVGFAYKERGVTPLEVSVSPSLPLPPRRPEHPPTSTVDVAGSECERFVPPPGLDVPGHIQQVRRTPLSLPLFALIHVYCGVGSFGKDAYFTKHSFPMLMTNSHTRFPLTHNFT